ncbi:hypothetical protein EDB81DRAFT_854192 [Dactylonectria macrodidyma]|uniref:SnoaL-like domain-containing protein n=1 Tax=Dactylonectria macrodidyma TaxID=307937 RepID=A0A9P9JFB4_9HYPO|nr:hypothetical protein EDB81DRAFT_854192 [Dactylonectria macrodidyma]
MPVSREQIQRLVDAFITNFNIPSAEKQIAIRSPKCVQRTLPASIGDPDRSNEEYAELFGAFVLAKIRNFNIGLAPGSVPIIDEANQTAVLHMRSTGDSDHGPYANEYMFILKVNKEGTLLDQVVEFMDSGYLKSFIQAVSGV